MVEALRTTLNSTSFKANIQDITTIAVRTFAVHTLSPQDPIVRHCHGINDNLCPNCGLCVSRILHLVTVIIF